MMDRAVLGSRQPERPSNGSDSTRKGSSVGRGSSVPQSWPPHWTGFESSERLTVLDMQDKC